MKAWADIRQFRNGRWFRETRFYRWKEDRWLRSEADLFFWSGQTETLGAPYFQAIYAIEDRDLVQPTLDQLEQARQRICTDLDCGITSLTYTLKLNSGVNNGWPVSDDGREIRFASPRVMGLYEDALPMSEEGLNLIWTLACPSPNSIRNGGRGSSRAPRHRLEVEWLALWKPHSFPWAAAPGAFSIGYNSVTPDGDQQEREPQ